MTDGVTVGQVGEDALVRQLLGRYGPLPPFVRVGPGDDAAVLDLSGALAGPVVLSTDTLVEGQDFRQDWSTGADVGVKVAAQSFADLAAMGARPVALLVSLAGPGSVPAGFAHGLADGLDEECRRAGAATVGGDVSDAPCLVLTGTALGVLPGPQVLRSGARPGDVVALAGVLGRSSAGLALLQAGLAGDGHEGAGPAGWRDRLLAAHRAPRPPYPAGPAAAAAGATAMIDTSDGLLRDAGRVAAASGVVLDLDLAALRAAAGPPALADLSAAAVRLADLSATAGLPADLALVAHWLLTGGEDHALLACFPAGVALPDGFAAVGLVREASGERAGVLVDGDPWPGSEGWHHWA